MAVMQLLFTETSIRLRRDGGAVGRIYGSVEARTGVPGANLPMRRRVYLYSDDGELLSVTMSRATDGAYEFRFLPMGSAYTVLTRDFDKQLAPVCLDELKPELRR